MGARAAGGLLWEHREMGTAPTASLAEPLGTGVPEPLGLLWALCPGRVQVELSPALEGQHEALGLLRNFASLLAWGSAKVKIDFCSKCDIA